MVLHIHTALPLGSASGVLKRGCCRPLLWGTLWKYQFQKNTCTVSDQRSLNPVSELWEWPEMREEKLRDNHMWYFLLCTLSVYNDFWRFLETHHKLILFQVLLQFFIEHKESSGIHNTFKQQLLQVCDTLYEEPSPSLNLTATSFGWDTECLTPSHTFPHL